MEEHKSHLTQHCKSFYPYIRVRSTSVISSLILWKNLKTSPLPSNSSFSYTCPSLTTITPPCLSSFTPPTLLEISNLLIHSNHLTHLATSIKFQLLFLKIQLMKYLPIFSKFWSLSSHRYFSFPSLIILRKKTLLTIKTNYLISNYRPISKLSFLSLSLSLLYLYFWWHARIAQVLWGSP